MGEIQGLYSRRVLLFHSVGDPLFLVGHGERKMHGVYGTFIGNGNQNGA